MPIHTRRSPLNLSAAPANHSGGMSYCRADQSSMCVQQVCVSVTGKESTEGLFI